MENYIFENKKIEKNIPLNDIRKRISRKDCFVWVDLENPTDKEYDFIQKTFKFHPLSIEDCKQPIDFPKIDIFDDHMFVVFHSIELEKEELKKKEIDIFCGKNFIVSVHKHISKVTTDLKERYARDPSLAMGGPDFVFHKLIDKVVDNYLPILDYWDDKIELLEDRILEGKAEDALEDISDTRRRILEFKRSVSPQREILNKLARGDSPFVSEDALMYFRDVYDHIMRAFNVLETQRDLIASVFEVYLSVISNKMNEVMKTLTIIATIFMPLTFITGLYGMNFKYMPELSMKYAYFVVVFAMIILGVGMAAYFKKKGWV